MSRVICSLPNASTNINGVDFVPHSGGQMISVEELSDDVIKSFCEIEGFKSSSAKPLSSQAAIDKAEANKKAADKKAEADKKAAEAAEAAKAAK